MSAQIQLTKTHRKIKSIGEAVIQYEAEQHEEQLRKARKAVKRARALVAEAERFLSEV